MIENWLLQNKIDKKTYKFKVTNITGNYINITDDIKLFLAKELVLNFVVGDWLKKVYKDEHHDKLKEHIENKVFPDENAHFNPRQSMWGEIFTSIIFEKLKKFQVPLRKLRYKECKDKAMRGKADVIAVNLIKNRLVITFGETKTKIQYKKPGMSRDGKQKLNDKGLAEEAYNGLACNYIDDNPEIVNYFAQRLYHDDNYLLADHFDTAVRDPKSYDKSFEIFLIFENNEWDKEILEHLNSLNFSIPDLHVNVILIEQLKDLIDSCYTLAPDASKELVYG